MASNHRVRLAAVGDESDMILLNRTLLSNCDLLEDPEDRPPYTLAELYRQVQDQVHRELGEQSSFSYGMIGPYPFGSALPGGTYTLHQIDGKLWAALFTFESEVDFQPEDWLQLHNACNRLPMFALYAGGSFYQQKGEAIFTGGKVLDNWERMAEIWFWLNTGYENGLSPEEYVSTLKKTEAEMKQEEWDQSVTELLQSCYDNQMLCEKGLQIGSDQLNECIETRDWNRLFKLQVCVADSVLWDAGRNPRHLACLKEAITAWENQDHED